MMKFVFLFFFLLFLKCFQLSIFRDCIGGVKVSVFAWSAVDTWGSSPDHVKPKTMILICVGSLQH